MKYIIALILLVTCAFANAQDSNPDQAIWNIFNQHNYNDHYPEVMEYYKQLPNPELLQEDTKTYLKLRENISKNKQDSVNYYFDKLLQDETITPSRKIRILYDWFLFNILVKGDYPKYSQIWHLMDKFTQTHRVALGGDYDFWRGNLKGDQRVCDVYNSMSSMYIKRDSLMSDISFNIDPRGIFISKIKNQEFSILFDTGYNLPCIISDSIAQELGVRKLFENDSIKINNSFTDIQWGILDSLFVGNIYIYNLPVVIKKTYYDNAQIVNISDSISLQNINEFKKNNQTDKTIILGVQVIEKIKQIQYNWTNQTISFPLTASENDSEPNLYMKTDGMIYLNQNFSINDLPINSFLDTGGDSFINMRSDFYENNKQHFLLDRLNIRENQTSFMIHEIRDFERYYLTQPTLTLESKKLNIENKEIIVDNYNAEYNVWLGIDFLKKVGPIVLLDYETMRIDAVNDTIQTYYKSNINQAKNTLISLWQGGEYFRANNLQKELIKELGPIPLIQDLYYKHEKYRMENKVDSAIYYLDQVIYNDSNFFGKYKILLLFRLFELQTNNKQNLDAYITLSKIKELLFDNPYKYTNEYSNSCHVMVNVMDRKLLNLTRQPNFRIERDSKIKQISFSQIENKELAIQGISNTTEASLIINPNSSNYLYMSESMAKKLGVKEVKLLVNDSIYLNLGIYLPNRQGILDSLKIGNISLYNIPVEIYTKGELNNDYRLMSEEDRHQIEQTLDKNIILGFPLLSRLGLLEFDWEKNTLSFPSESKVGKTDIQNDLTDMFQYDGDLFTRVYLNGLETVVKIDWKTDSFLKIDQSFYTKHSINFKLSDARSFPRYPNQVPEVFLPIVVDELLFKGKKVNTLNQDVKVSSQSEWPVKNYDGKIGYDFFKSLGKRTLLDFKTMTIRNMK